MPSRADYDRAFDAEASVEYLVIDEYELEAGFALDKDRLLSAARVLACPVKVNPPNWQHGRVLYSTARRYIADSAEGFYEDRLFLDIGTAKGFSSLCLRWALDDMSSHGNVVSLDVIDPEARVRRNTVAEVDGLLTLGETLIPFPDSLRVKYVQSASIDWLRTNDHRIHLAFLDGKHSGGVVGQELKMISPLQQPGDIVVLDDLQIPGIERTGRTFTEYSFRELIVKPQRRYGIMVKS